MSGLELNWPAIIASRAILQQQTSQNTLKAQIKAKAVTGDRFQNQTGHPEPEMGGEESLAARPISKEAVKKKLFINSIITITVSALVFIAILAWFEFIKILYDTTFTVNKTEPSKFYITYTKFWYAIFITCFVMILVYIIYRFEPYCY